MCYKAGTIIKLPDGRIGTVVYNGLDGVGIKWGKYDITMDDIIGNGNTTHGAEVTPNEYEWFPEAMLRKPYSSAELECVGDEFEIIQEGSNI